MSKGLFVTGTDTGVGKTLVCLGLMRRFRKQGRRVAGMKPVASGCEVRPEGLRNPDAVALQAEASVELAYTQVNPYAYEASVAPHIAAARTGHHVDIHKISGQFRRIAREVDGVIVEGIGGWKVPLGEKTDVSDLAVALGLPVLLVVAVRLGCLNHAILSWDAIQASRMPCAGWVANCMDEAMLCAEENIACLSARFGVLPLAIIPNLGEQAGLVEQVSQTLDLDSQFG